MKSTEINIKETGWTNFDATSKYKIQFQELNSSTYMQRHVWIIEGDTITEDWIIVRHSLSDKRNLTTLTECQG